MKMRKKTTKMRLMMIKKLRMKIVKRRDSMRPELWIMITSDASSIILTTTIAAVSLIIIKSI